MFEALIDRGYQVEFHSHARAILDVDFPAAASELESALAEATIPIEEIIAGGGGEAKGTQRLRRALATKGWVKTTFVVEKRINGVSPGKPVPRSGPRTDLSRRGPDRHHRD